MLLYIIVIVIIYLTDTYICKKIISHILLTYKNNFLTNKIMDCFGTKILVIVYKSLVRFKDECNNITYYLNIFITKCSALFLFFDNIAAPTLLQDAANATLRSQTLRRNHVQCNNRKRWCKKPVKKGVKCLR